MRFVRRLGDGPDSLDVDALAGCLREYPVSLAVLFGSHASDSASDLSDLDLAVRFQESIPEDERLELLDELTTAVTRATGFEAVDVVDLERVNPTLGYEALSNGTVLVGDENEAVDLEAKFLVLKLDFEPVREEWQSALSERIREGAYGRRG